ncbi:hypothetical protein D3C71_1970470 [compost metagenome]
MRFVPLHRVAGFHDVHHLHAGTGQAVVVHQLVVLIHRREHRAARFVHARFCRRRGVGVGEVTGDGIQADGLCRHGRA